MKVLSTVASVWDKERIGVRFSPNGVYGGMGSEDNLETYDYVISKLAEEKSVGYIHIMDGLAFGFHNKCAVYTMQVQCSDSNIYSAVINMNLWFHFSALEACIPTECSSATADTPKRPQRLQ